MSKVLEFKLKQSQASLKQCESEKQELRDQVGVPRGLQYISWRALLRYVVLIATLDGLDGGNTEHKSDSRCHRIRNTTHRLQSDMPLYSTGYEECSQHENITQVIIT